MYVGCDRYVYAIDTGSGGLRWKYQTGELIQSPLTVADGIVYFGCEGDDNTPTGYVKTNGYLYGLDAKTGGLKWKYQATGIGDDDSLTDSPPIIVDGILYYETGDGLCAIE